MSDANGIPIMLPEEAYRLTERARLMSDAAAEGMQEYGLGGLAYAKARDFATKANQARAWQDENMPEVIPEGSTAIPDVDKQTRPKTADGKNYGVRRLPDPDPQRASLPPVRPTHRGDDQAHGQGPSKPKLR